MVDTMEGAEQTLVIILSGALAIFLVLGIIALFKFIEILNHIKTITAKAERLAETAETVGEFFRYSAGPAAVGRLFANIFDTVFRKDGKKGDKGDKDGK